TAAVADTMRNPETTSAALIVLSAAFPVSLANVVHRLHIRIIGPDVPPPASRPIWPHWRIAYLLVGLIGGTHLASLGGVPSEVRAATVAMIGGLGCSMGVL